MDIENVSACDTSSNQERESYLQNETGGLKPKLALSDMQDSEFKVHTELSNDVAREEEVHVIYLNMQDGDGPQVLDLSNLLVHEGIQMIEPSSTTDQLCVDQEMIVCQNIVIENNCGNEITMVTSQSEAQSAHALLHLSKIQGEVDTVQVSDILAAHRQSEEDQNAVSAEALLQLSSEQSSGTYIVDDNGAMIPISQVGSSTLLEVDDTGVSSLAICVCWCGREFISQEDLDRHKMAHKYQNSQTREVSGIQKCVLCLESFATPRDLRLHHSELHPEGTPWECSVCHRKFLKKVALKAHMRVHNTITKYQCTSCKKVFFYKTALNRHLRMHTCEKPFKCTICGDTYQSLWDLRKHRMNHQPTKLYPCDICTKVFKQKQTLFVHSRIHTGHRPYSCDVCCRTFSLKTTLVQHRRIHTGEKPNVCKMCHRAFRQNSTLKAHMRTHTNQKPYICRYCKMRFAYKDEVQEHEHLHAQNKNWQCDKCGMWFKNQSLLSRHSRVHTNERPFQCSTCHKTFVQSGSLQAHMRSHTKEKPYQCRMCSKSYYTSGTLLIHIRKAHNVDAKSVREVFPVIKYVEDQKVFTIRNKLLVNNETVISGLDQDVDKMDNEATVGEILCKENIVVEELVETSSEVLVQDDQNLPDRTVSGDTTKPVTVDSIQEDPGGYELHEVDEIECVDETVVSTVVDVDPANSPEKSLGKRGKRNTKKMKDNELTDDLETKEDVKIKVDQETFHFSHAAQDRQEAALGLAELSLIGGEGAVVEKPAKTRTFFKEEEEDENDPNVTKIILSKEGGIMNSQDPHQCTVCGRIFGRKSIMVEHLRIHTDEKPYVCDFCNAGFRQNAQLRSHIRNKHTKVERYQCSFCHKRFLSRSITVRHINFHHKLKVKFCGSVDRAWNINNAVWSDDNFEFNASETLFVKPTKQSAEKMVKEEISESCLPEGGTPAEESGKEKLTQISTIRQAEEMQVKRNAGQETEGKSLGSASWKKGKNGPPSKTRKVSGKSGVNDEKRSSPSIDEMNSDSQSNSDESKLICGTCAMQFSGISSLRCHLKKVHNTTLDKSNLSVFYETENTSGELKVDPEIMTQAGNSNMSEGSDPEEATESSQAKCATVKIIGYDSRQLCADDPQLMPYSCLMCTMRYISKSELHNHMKTHADEDVERVGMHRCDVCLYVMKNTQQVTKHILKFHGVPQIFICSICHREFFQLSSVHRHMRFFHKWEIKIRGESSIPVLVKPAPLSIQKPGCSPKIQLKQSASDQINQRQGRLNSSDEDESITCISLEGSDMESVQIFQAGGQKILYQVLDSGSSEQLRYVVINDDQCDHSNAAVEVDIGDKGKNTLFGDNIFSLNPSESTHPITLKKGSSHPCKPVNITTQSESKVSRMTQTSLAGEKVAGKQEDNGQATSPIFITVERRAKPNPESTEAELAAQLITQFKNNTGNDALVNNGNSSKVIKILNFRPNEPKPAVVSGGKIDASSKVIKGDTVVNIRDSKTHRFVQDRKAPTKNNEMRGVSTSKGGHQQPQSNVKCNFPNGKGPIVMSVLDIGRKDVSKKEKGHSYSLLSLPATQTHTSNITGGNTTKQDTGLPGLREISSSVNVTADNSANGPLPCTKDNVAPSSNDNQCNDGQLIHIYLSTTPSNSNEVSGMSCTEEIPTGNANGAYRAEAHLKTEKDDLCEYTAHITQDSTAAEKIMQQSENTRDSTHITRETADKTDQEEDFKTIMLATKLGGKEFLEKTEDDLVSPGSTKESKKSHSVTYQVMARENSGSDTSVKMSGNLKETNKVQQSGKLSPLKRGPAKNANTPSRSFSPVKSPHNSSVKKVETKSLNQFNAKDIKKAPSKTNPPTAVSPKGIQKSSGSLSAIPSPISLNKSSAGEKTISKLSLECSPPPKVVSTPKKRQVYVAEKPAEKLQEPDVVRRSSSGRIIKRKQFDDEITDVNSAKKSKGNSLMMR